MVKDWKYEKRALKEKIVRLERKLDEQDKRGRRNCVVIKDAKFKYSTLRKEDESFVQEKRDIKPRSN